MFRTTADIEGMLHSGQCHTVARIERLAVLVAAAVRTVLVLRAARDATRAESYPRSVRNSA